MVVFQQYSIYVSKYTPLCCEPKRVWCVKQNKSFFTARRKALQAQYITAYPSARLSSVFYWSNFRSNFKPFVYQSSCRFETMQETPCGCQRTCPIVYIMFRSEDIQAVKVAVNLRKTYNFRRVGENSGPIFIRQWTKVYEISKRRREQLIIFNAVSPLSISCSSPEILALTVAIELRSRRKQVRSFGAPNICGAETLKILWHFSTLFYRYRVAKFG